MDIKAAILKIFKSRPDLLKAEHLNLDPKKVAEFQASFKGKTQKSQPSSSQVHVPSTGEDDEVLIKHKGTVITVGKEKPYGEHDPKNLDNLERALEKFFEEERMEKSELTTQGREHIKDSNFALPEEKKYPIHDLAHARNALSRVAQHGTPEEKAKVKAAVYRKYPELNKVNKSDLPKRIATVAVMHQGRLLMGKRKDNKKWTLPGGHVDMDETFKEGALREVLEETGIELDPRFIFPLTGIFGIVTKYGNIEVQGWMYDCPTEEEPTGKNDPDEEVSKWEWVDCSEGLPPEIDKALHVPKERDIVLSTLGLIKKSVDADSDASMLPGIDNLEGGLLKSMIGEDSNAAYSDLSQMQDLVYGMDYEMANGYVDESDAREAAIHNLAQDPDYYTKLYDEENSREDLIDNNVNKDTEQTEESPLANVGYNIDLGSGNSREPGHIGFDLYPYDNGTYVHDLNLGIPLEDNSVRKVQMVNAYHEMDLDDPKALLSEINRVLMPGGQFVYEGPNEIYNHPDWTQDAPGLELAKDERVEKVEGTQAVRQTFTRVAAPDPSTANDAEPRVGIAQYDMLPADALLAMDAVGYYYSDATSSGRGNRAMGYPSQGGLLQKDNDWMQDPNDDSTRARDISDLDKCIEKACDEGSRGYVLPTTMGDYAMDIEDWAEGLEKGGPGSGPQGGGSSSNPNSMHMSTRDKYRLIRGEPVGKTKTELNVEKILKSDRVIPIFKATQQHKQIVYGVVLEPDSVDAQEDVMDPEEIEKTAHKYLIDSRVVGSEHTKPARAVPVESFIAPSDFDVQGQNGPQTVKKGSWVLGVKVLDPEDWQKVLDGEYTGFSVGGLGQRTGHA